MIEFPYSLSHENMYEHRQIEFVFFFLCISLALMYRRELEIELGF